MAACSASAPRPTARRRGYFIYDVWDPAAAHSAVATRRLPNRTGTDIFCSSRSAGAAARAASVFIAGGDNWTGTGHHQHRQQQQQSLRLHRQRYQRLAHAQRNMNRARWYSSSITLLNGEVYIQGGSGGTDYPEIRATDGTLPPADGAGTGSLDFMYPRNFVAPDGRVFGYDSNGKMYYVNTAGTRLDHQGGPVRGAHRQRCQRGHVPAGPHPAVRRQFQRRASSSTSPAARRW